MLNPCCCLSPRIGTFILAVIDLAFSALYSINVVGALVDSRFHYEMWGAVAFCICLVLLALLLLLGAIQNSQEKVRLWLILWIVWVILALVFQVFNVYTHRVGPAVGGSSLGSFLIFLYQIWVVYAYLTELRYGAAGLTYCPAQVTV